MEVPTNKPLSYDASKAVLKSMNLETREAINKRIPSLRVIDSLFPYELEKVLMSTDRLNFNDREWFFIKRGNDHCDLMMSSGTQEAPIRRLDMSADAAYRKLFDAYIRNGTRIRTLYHTDIPEMLMEKDPEELRLKVQNLELPAAFMGNHVADYEHLTRFIDLGTLKGVIYQMNSNNRAILDKPEIWLASDKPIGSRFSWGQTYYDDVLDIFKHYEKEKGAVPWKHPRLGNSFHAHGVKLSMEGGRNLVMFGGATKKYKWFDIAPWTFDIEVMAADV
ncbi:hypothetical protein GCK72_007868 [Caenorhabditis remanei]|uniref:Uncharacterized protein n=1 Tax=Caenorhabditis remanei TaxID=31234 RepID=A0A6A5HJ60_CAERE|nr:hypothetical protein GCK72_007868 [Caenorhabditis remanei]KAF1767908.1 hypothetical protein GCK72_007868 [Caenorhabditis remanei]